MRLFGNKGYAMVAVMVTVAIMATIITAVMTLALADVSKAKLWRNKNAAFYMAESGVHEAVYQIIEAKVDLDSLKADYPNGRPSLRSEETYDFGPGKKFEVWVKQENDNSLTITSRGTVNKVTKVVQRVLIPTGVAVFPKPPNNYPVIENNNTNNADDDYHDPGYVAPVIEISMPEGDDEGSYTLGNKDVASLTGDHYFSRIETGNNTELTITGPAVISVAGDVNFGTDSILTFKGDVIFIIDGNLQFQQNSEIIPTEGSVKFYVNRAVIFANNGKYGTETDSTKLIVYTSTEPAPLTYTVAVDNNSLFYGGICAPAAQVNIGNNAEIWGAIVGDEVNIGNNAEVGYDPDMKDITEGGTGGEVSWTQGAWSEP